MIILLLKELNLNFLDIILGITDFDVLTVLKNCPRLTKLDLRGNEVCGISGYRIRIKELCPSLRILDNEPLNSL
jgi:Leucine-rich repeat (LRR) protein